MDLARLTTPRLALRPMRLDDLDALHALLIEAGVRRYLLDGEIWSRAQVQAMLERSVALHTRDRTGLWAMSLSDDTFAGFVALWPFHEPPVTELAFALAERHWGRGYASEGARAMLDYARDALGWHAIEATTDTPNVDSQRVLDRLGFAVYAEIPGAFGTQRRYRRRLGD
jgi:RimJ/RimL family protein N-acetyltransferase